MKFIGLQAGHQNIASNIDPSLRTGTGAPGEMEFNIKLRDALGKLLINKGFQVQLDDANANGSQNTIGKDFDFYLAIHYDANIYGTGGGCISAPDASVDASNAESRRIVDFIRKAYFIPYTNDTGIVEHPERVNVNMTYYYMWNVLTAKTPCGLIECGVGQDAHDSVILADTDRVASAIAKGICLAFGVQYDTPAPPPPIVSQPTTPPVPPTTPPVSIPPSSPPPPPVVVDYKPYLIQIKGVLNAKWKIWEIWKERSQIKQIVSQSGV